MVVARLGFETSIRRQLLMSGLAPTLPLRNGAEIPVLGLGTSPLQGSRVRDSGPDSPRGRLPADRHGRELPQ